MSGVEYALVVSLLLVGSTASFEMMDEGIQEHYTDTAEDIGQKDLAAFDATTTTAAATSSTTSTITAAPATTTAAPTTTAAAVPTTIAAPDEVSKTSWRDRTYYDKGWVAKTRITLEDENGDYLKKATVSVTFTLADGTTASATGTTNDRGKITFKRKGLSSSDFKVVVTIDSIVGESGTTYAPSKSSFELDT